MFKNWAARHWAAHGTGPHGTGPHGTGPHGTGPHGTGPNGTGPNFFRDGVASGPSCHTPPCYLLRGTAALAQNATEPMDEDVIRWAIAAADPRKELLF